MKKLFYVAVVAMVFVSTNSQAQFRCGGKIIEKSRFSKLDVARYCGEPLMKDSYTKDDSSHHHGNKSSGGASCIQVDQWYYTQGPRQTTYVVEFEKGFVIGVRQGADKP